MNLLRSIGRFVPDEIKLFFILFSIGLPIAIVVVPTVFFIFWLISRALGVVT